MSEIYIVTMHHKRTEEVEMVAAFLRFEEAEALQNQLNAYLAKRPTEWNALCEWESKHPLQLADWYNGQPAGHTNAKAYYVEDIPSPGRAG